MSSEVTLVGSGVSPAHPELGTIYLGDDGRAYIVETRDDGLSGFFSVFKSIGSWFKKNSGMIFVTVGSVLTAAQQQAQQQGQVIVTDPAQQQQQLTPAQILALQQEEAARRAQTFQWGTTEILLAAVVAIALLRR
jgi:hypothetical protein